MRTPSERLAAGLPTEGKPKRNKKSAPEVSAIETAPAPAKRKKVKEPEKVDLSTYDADGDLVDIWERRMINPDQRQSKPIRISTPGMHLRWINLSNTGRYQRARYEEGWIPVQKKELVDEREIYGVSFTVEGFVCRGEKQTEMLMKIPEAVWKKIRTRKYELVKKSQRAVKDNMLSGGAKYFGDKYNTNRGEEIAETLGHFRGDIKFGTEQVEPEPGDLEPAYEGAE